MTIKQEEVLNKIKEKIKEALEFGTGKLKEDSACDLHDLKKVIYFFEEQDYKKTIHVMDNMDSVITDRLPSFMISKIEDMRHEFYLKKKRKK